MYPGLARRGQHVVDRKRAGADELFHVPGVLEHVEVNNSGGVDLEVVPPQIEAYEEVIAALTDTADLDEEQETLENESEVVLGLIQKIISENAQTAMDQEEYNRRYDAYSERFEAARKRLAEIAELRQERNAKKTRIRLFMENMNSHQELVQSFDEELWYSTVDYVTVYEDKRLVFTFRDGRQIEITAELWRAA